MEWIISSSGWSRFRLTKILSLFVYLHLYLYKNQLIGEHLGSQDSMETILLLVS